MSKMKLTLEVVKLRKQRDEYLADLEKIVAILREYGYGQGQIDTDIAECVREAIEGER